MADNNYLPQTILETPEPELEPTEAEERGTLTEEMLRRILDDNREANADLIRQVTAPRGQPLQQDAIAPELEFTLEGLPDPAVDPAGFHKGYMARFNVAAQKYGREVEQRATQGVQRALSDKDVISRADAMIKAAVPEADEEIIAYAGGVIANRYKAQGKNPMGEMRANTENVAQDIADYIEDMRGKFGGGRRSVEEPTSGRTRGLVQPRARAPQAPKERAADKEDPQGFYKELTAIQAKGRIY